MFCDVNANFTSYLDVQPLELGTHKIDELKYCQLILAMKSFDIQVRYDDFCFHYVAEIHFACVFHEQLYSVFVILSKL